MIFKVSLWVNGNTYTVSAVLDVICIPSIDTTSGLLVLIGDIYLNWLSYDNYQTN